jgi:parallel beta-helix repeat protein
MTRSSHSNRRRDHVLVALRRPCLRAVEALEPRVLLSTYAVTNTNDSGPGSLRQAILDANANPGADGVSFNLPGPAPHVIAPASPLPIITDSLGISGRSQPDYQPGTATPVVVLTGRNAGPSASGLVIAPGAIGSSVQGLVVDGFGGDGLVLQAPGCHVVGCYIGTDPSGMLASGNGGNGVIVSASGAVVGGAFADRNVISANGKAGVVASTTSGPANIAANFIGTNATGTGPLGNRHEGVLATGPVSIGSGAVISGNGYSGVVLSGGTLTGTHVVASYIGTNLYGTAPLANGTASAAPYRDGITLLGGGATIGLPSNVVGSTFNVISGNRGAGIYLAPTSTASVQSNLVGTDFSGSLPLGNDGDGIVIATDHFTLGGNLAQRPSVVPLVLADGGNVIGGNGGDGILVLGSNDVVQNEYVGVGAAGAAVANHGNGIEVRGGTQNTIGRNASMFPFTNQNVISGNAGAGVLVHGGPQSGDSILGNYIGIQVNGDAPLGNGGNGVELFAGGATVNGNLIGGNAGSGIYLGPTGGTASAGTNSILNNRIGDFPPGVPGGHVAVPAAVPSPNFLGNAQDGITLFHSNSNTFTSNSIVGNALDGVDIVASSGNTLTRNTITNNGGNGVTIRDDPAGGGPSNGNSVLGSGISLNQGSGVSVRQDAPGAGEVTGNSILHNSIFSNGGPRIDLSGDSNPQTPPMMVSSQSPLGSTATTVQFTLEAQPGTYTIDFVATSSTNPSGTPSDFDAGSTTITVGADPTMIYSATIARVPVGDFVIATATGALGTSEFSPGVATTSPPPQVVSEEYDFTRPWGPIRIYFNQDVSASLTAADLTLHNEQTGQDFAPSGVLYNRSMNFAQFALPANLPVGDYIATLMTSQVTNSAGQPVGGGTPLHFAYLPGDLNGDRTVDFADLLELAQAYGTQAFGATDPIADLNFDHVVDFKDLLILAQHYGKTLPPP